MTSYPPPTATPDQAAALRKDLEASGWGVDAVAHLLGDVADAALRREIRLPAVRAVRRVLAEDRAAGATPSAPAVLTALFMLGQTVTTAELDAALRRTRTAGALAMGLVESVPGQGGQDGSVRACVDLRPHEVAGLPGTPATGPAGGPGGAGAPLTPAQVHASHLVGTRVPAAPAPASPGPREGQPAEAGSGVDSQIGEAGAGQAPATQAVADQRWWVASDLGELTTGRALEADHVLGIGGAGLTLASLTPRRPVGRALDLGCGCGIQTLYLLSHASHVTATDISERALAFTAFNAALAGVDPSRLDLRRGSFLEPVAGQVFDLIATNPPFVLTPPAVREAGLPLMEYRDAGRPVLPELVPALGGHLAPGGTVVMLGNWEHHRFQDWRERVSAWLPEGTDAWVIQRETQDPVEYATMWLRDGGTTPERDRTGFEAALEAWIADFEQRGVEAVGFGYLVLHRPDPDSDGAAREPWRLLEEVTSQPAGPLGEHLARSLEVRSGLAAMDDDAVAHLRPVIAPDVTEERYYQPGQAEPSIILLRQGGGFGRSVQAGTALAALAGVADGELSIAQIAAAVAALTGAQGQASKELRSALVADVRRLAADGFLELEA